MNTHGVRLIIKPKIPQFTSRIKQRRMLKTAYFCPETTEHEQTEAGLAHWVKIE
jgi:hypothetical protein